MRNRILYLRSIGKTYREISEEVGCSLGTVSNHLSPGVWEKHVEDKIRNKRTRILKSNSRVKVSRDSREARHKRMLKSRYNLTYEEWESLYESQDGRCLICDSHKKMGGLRGLVVDHCHESNRIRGMLCNRCNTGLGLLGDNISGIKKAESYLIKPDMLAKEELVNGEWYLGTSRNSKIALWDEGEDSFIQICYSFGYNLGKLKYFGDIKNNKSDGFIPILRVDMISSHIINETKKLVGY